MKKWILTTMLVTLAARASAYTVPYETWMGAYIGETKVGYLSFKIDKAESGYRMLSFLDVGITSLGARITLQVTKTVQTDTAYNPLKEDFTMSSGGTTTHVAATYGKNAVACVTTTGAGSSTKSVPIPAGISLAASDLLSLDPKNPIEIGREYLQHYFNPLTLAIDEQKVKVEREEKIEVDGKTYNALVLQNSSPMGDMTVWQERGGDVVKAAGVMGIVLYRQSREEAVSGIQSGTCEDMAVKAVVRPDREIPSPRELRKLDIIFSGFDSAKRIPSDSRQKVSPVKGRPGSIRFQISAASFDPEKSLKRPVRRRAMETYLAGSAYIDSSSSEIRLQARRIVASEKSAYLACCRIRKWVHANLRTRADVGVIRAASDVLESKEGVCRDYAILFAALAQSQGIPTRIASGLIYTDGAFYYHAWVECFVGEWVSFDATLSTDFVDATHIKLAEGDATSMFELAKVIGSLTAEIQGVGKFESRKVKK